MPFRSFGKGILNQKSGFKIPLADVGERTGDVCRMEMHLSERCRIMGWPLCSDYRAALPMC